MAVITIAAIILLAKHLKAGPVPAHPSHYHSNRPCAEFIVAVDATTQSAMFDLPQVNSNIDATAYAIDHDTWTNQFSFLKNITISGTYDISVQLCVPSNGSKKDRLQIATHGLVFDKRYWDAPINPSEYSYVENAMDAGYSILTYDRLGTGKSDKPDAYSTVAATLELEILREITEMAKSGDIMKYVRGDHIDTHQSFNKFIHVGHSFGSFLTSALLTTYPEVTDGAVITGYIPNKYLAQLRLASFELLYAPTADPKLFGGYSSGYMVDSTVGAIQAGFFSVKENTTTGIGGFEPALLNYAFDVRQPVTVNDFASPGLLNLGVAHDYKSPVQFMLAEYDYVVCLGDCKGVYDPAIIESLYPQASDVNFYIQEGTGHGLTMHKGASVGYKATFDWLDANGL